jgi:hypothetical protein
MRFLLMLMVFFCLKCSGQQQQLILKVSQLSEQSVVRISEKLNALQGVHFSGYVQHASCLLIRYDTQSVKNPAVIYKALYAADKKMKYTVVEGLTAYDVIDGRLDE